MTARLCPVLVAAAFLSLPILLPAADFKPEVIKAGKRATALVVLPSGNGFGSSFCIEKSGYFVTNRHVVAAANGNPVKLVLHAGEDDQRELEATVARVDMEHDLALLYAKSETEIPTLKLGSAAGLVETQQLIIFGYPFGTALRVKEQQYPNVSINVGRITSLRKTAGKLEIIQLDAEVNPGNSGGPVLNEAGEVIGVVRAKVADTAVNFAIPVNRVHDLASKPEVVFSPPVIPHEKRFQAQLFSVGVANFLGGRANYTVKLILGEGATKREILCERQKDGTYIARTPPMVRRAGGLVEAEFIFSDGAVRGQAEDTPIKGGKAGIKLSELRRVERKGDRWEFVGRNDEEDAGERLAEKKFNVTVGGAPLELPWSQLQGITIVDREELTAVEYEIAVLVEGAPLATKCGQIEIGNDSFKPETPRVAGPGAEPAPGGAGPPPAAGMILLNGQRPWPAYLDAPPIAAGRDGLKGLGRRYIRTPRGNYLRKDFSFDLIFNIGPTDKIVFVGLGEGRSQHHQGEPDNSVMFRIHSQEFSKGEVVLSKSGAIGGQKIGNIPNGTHRATIRKEGNNVVFAIDVDNNGPSPEDMQKTVPNIREFAPFLDDTNAYLFFGGEGTFQQVRLSEKTKK